MSNRSSNALLAVVLGLAGCGSAPPKPETNGASAPVPIAVKERVARDYAEALEALRAGHHADAEQMFTKLTRDEPALSGPWANLGVIYRERGDTKAAEDAFKHAVELNPRNGTALNELGVIARERGDLLTAEASYQQCIKVQPEYAGCYLNLGILYELYLGRYADALDAYRTYQTLAAMPDERVQGWVDDLARRLVAGRES
jgi:Flp pilus assembly protein TadD